MKIVSIAIIFLALVVGIAPLFLDCQSQGRSLTTTDGKSVPMKCHWTAIAEMALAIPIGLAGILSLRNKGKESRLSIGSMTMVLGALVILLPTVLIGVCANPMMLCNMVMRPLLVLTGTLIGLGGLFMVITSQRMQTAAA